MPKKTRLPERLIGHLRRDPTATRQQLSSALGVSYQAVQKHLRRLEEQGLVLPGFLISPRLDQQRHEFWVFIETRFDHGADRSESEDYQGQLCQRIARELTEEERWLSDLAFVGVQILLGGGWDIVLRLAAEDADAVGRFVTRYLRGQPEIVRTSTAWTLNDVTS